MSRRNKERGRELEDESVAAAKAAGLEARRVFASGQYKNQLGEDFAGDVVIEGLRCEMKRRKSGFGVIYDAFTQDQADVVGVRADRKERLWIVKDELFAKLLKGERDG